MADVVGRLANQREKIQGLLATVKAGNKVLKDQQFANGQLPNGFAHANVQFQRNTVAFCDDEENPVEDELTANLEDDPMKILNVGGAFTADFRVNHFPVGDEGVGSHAGNPSFLMQRDSSSILAVPERAYLRIGFGNVMGRESRIGTYSVVIDLCVNLKVQQCDGGQTRYGC